MSHSAAHGNIVQLDSRSRATQHQPAPAHVAAPDKLCGKQQAVPENFQQRLHIFRAGDAAQQDERAPRSARFVKQTRVLQQRAQVAQFGHIDWNRGHGLELGNGDEALRWDEPAARRNDNACGNAGRRCGKGFGVGELAAEIKSAEERVKLGNRCAFAAETDCQRKLRAIAQ